MSLIPVQSSAEVEHRVSGQDLDQLDAQRMPLDALHRKAEELAELHRLAQGPAEVHRQPRSRDQHGVRSRPAERAIALHG